MKIWPAERLPESLLFELDSGPAMRPERGHLPVINDPAASGIAQIEATLRSSCSNLDQALLSLSSGTSYGKEPIAENTIEQILGKIERSHLGEKKDKSYDSFDQSNNFRRKIEAKIFGIKQGNFAQKSANGAK